MKYTINLILDRLYERQEIATAIPKNEMKELLILSTKNVHFTFNDNIYTQIDGVAMSSPLGPVIAGIFMVELERTVNPKLSQHMLPWKRYVDDTIVWIKEESINFVTEQLNTFHVNIEFTHELEKENKISFLDVHLIRKSDTIETTVYRKPTDNDLFELECVCTCEVCTCEVSAQLIDI